MQQLPRWLGWVAAFACAAGASFVAYCNIYTPDLVGDSGIPEAGSGIGWWSGMQNTDASSCFSAKVPTPADRPPPGDTSEIAPIYLAVGAMRLGSQNTNFQSDLNAWEDIGFDLDGVCTNSPTCGTNDPIVSCKPTLSEVAYDGNYCRDNTFGRLEVQASTIQEVGGKYGLNDDAFNCALCIGAYNFVIKISHYNGGANDDSVRLDAYPSPGLETILPWSCQDPNWRAHPCFTADMPWLIRDTAVTADAGGPSLPDAVIADSNAYVKDGYLVATLPANTLFWFPHNATIDAGVATAFPLKFTQGIMVGKITKGQDGTWTLDDGTIAGRASESDIISGFNLIGFCATTDPTNYNLMESFLHGKLDILTSGQTDPNTTCDGISVGIAFTARQATAGNLVHVADLVPCSNDGGADAGDGGTDAPVD